MSSHLERSLAHLRDLFQPGERLVSEGVASEPRFFDGRDPWRALGTPSDPIVVTDRRILWMPRWIERWTASVPFDAIHSYREVTRAHRYAMVLDHDPIMRLRWVFAHRLLRWRWGDAEALRRPTQAVLVFSHRDTKAARSIRAALEARGVSARPSVSLATQVQQRSTHLDRRLWRLAWRRRSVGRVLRTDRRRGS